MKPMNFKLTEEEAAKLWEAVELHIAEMKLEDKRCSLDAVVGLIRAAHEQETIWFCEQHASWICSGEKMKEDPSLKKCCNYISECDHNPKCHIVEYVPKQSEEEIRADERKKCAEIIRRKISIETPGISADIVMDIRGLIANAIEGSGK